MLRRLGDGHHRGFLRPRHCHAYGTFNQLHSDGETEVRTQGCAYGESRGQAAFPVQGVRSHDNHGQRLRIRRTP